MRLNDYDGDMMNKYISEYDLRKLIALSYYIGADKFYIETYKLKHVYLERFIQLGVRFSDDEGVTKIYNLKDFSDNSNTLWNILEEVVENNIGKNADIFNSEGW